MRNKKITVEESPLVSPDTVVVKKRHKDLGIDYKTIKLFRDIAKVVAPPPILTVSQWADRYRKLSAESSAEPGQWNTDRAPYQREIMDAINDPECEEIVIMSSAQVGKTELILNIIGYFIAYDPAPMLVVQPTVKPMAEDFSKDRLSPMIRDTPSLNGFITIRFYITLKPQTSNLRIDTLQYQESLYPYYTTRQQSESITTLFATFNLSFRSKQSR